MHKGVPQGGPLSPLLFVLVLESLSQHLRDLSTTQAHVLHRCLLLGRKVAKAAVRALDPAQGRWPDSASDASVGAGNTSASDADVDALAEP